MSLKFGMDGWLLPKKNVQPNKCEQRPRFLSRCVNIPTNICRLRISLHTSSARENERNNNFGGRKRRIIHFGSEDRKYTKAAFVFFSLLFARFVDVTHGVIDKEPPKTQLFPHTGFIFFFEHRIDRNSTLERKEHQKKTAMENRLWQKTFWRLFRCLPNGLRLWWMGTFHNDYIEKFAKSFFSTALASYDSSLFPVRFFLLSHSRWSQR